MSFPAKALYDYEAKSTQELSIKVGDIFTVLTQHESGWWVIELNGKKGIKFDAFKLIEIYPNYKLTIN
jgi:hypothetical protein